MKIMSQIRMAFWNQYVLSTLFSLFGKLNTTLQLTIGINNRNTQKLELQKLNRHLSQTQHPITQNYIFRPFGTLSFHKHTHTCTPP